MDHDAVIVGASFAGLACATTLAGRGAAVTVLDARRDAGEKLHTTGILVRDALDQVPLLDGLPPRLVRRIERVRLYAPSLKYIDLALPGYYFLATDTPGLMRWLAARATAAGARILWGCRFKRAWPIQSGYNLGASYGSTRILVGADGPRSAVARSLALGQNSQFLAGIEHEYTDAPIPAADRLHCFIDRRCMPGYIGWVLQGVGVTQVGLARRQAAADEPGPVAAMERFLDKIAPLFDLRGRVPAGVRAGLIPCGGIVHPVARPRALLIGDAAGMVSPLTAGGIHLALRHGARAGHVIADFLAGAGEEPGAWAARAYPRLRIKRALRCLFDHCQSDRAFDLLLGSAPLRWLARRICFNDTRACAAFGIHSAAIRPFRPQEFPMQIQVHAGSRAGGGALIETVTAMTQEALGRFAAHITRIDVHMSDENGSKGGRDKRCVVEAHMEGRKPVAVTDNAETMKQAVQGAIDKLVRMLDSTVGRMREHRKDGVEPS